MRPQTTAHIQAGEVAAMRNSGIPLALFLCCGWPIIANLLGTFIYRNLIKRDWTSIQWSEIHFPWSKDQ